MISEWPEFQLGERCTVKSSKRIFAHEYVDTGIPFMRSKDVIDKALGNFTEYDLYIPKERFFEIKRTHGSPRKGDLLMSSVGNRSGQPYVIQDEGDFHFKDGNILWLSDFNDINSNYLAYWLKSEIGQDKLSSVMIGSAQKAITIDSIRKLWVSFPPVEYQNKAAEILLSLDHKIELNRQTNQCLEEIAQAIFKSWFVDFDPTRAKITAKENGQDPERAAMAAISGKTLEQLDQLSPEQQAELKSTAALFPDTLTDSELGEIPEGWEPKELGEFIRLQGGLSYKSEFIGSGRPMVTMGCIEPNKRFNFEKLKLYSGQFKPQHALKPGDLVISTRDVTQARITLGAPAMIPSFLGDELILATNLYKLENTGEYLPNEYLFEILRTTRYREQIIASAKGTTVLMLTKDALLKYKIACPEVKLIEIASKFLKPVYSSIDTLSSENIKLTGIRDTLLPKLLAGEMEFPDVN